MKWTSIVPRAQIRSTAGGSAPIQIVPGAKGGTAMPSAAGRKAPGILPVGRRCETRSRGDALTQRTWDRIESARERWNVLRHPFYRRWSAGELSGEELARYSGQYRHAVQAIAAVSEAAAE